MHGQENDDVKPAAERMKLTYDDFLLFPDDGKRHELIDGEHYVTPSPNTKHQRVSGNLHFLIRAWLEEHPIGQVFYAPFDVVFTKFDVVEPDLLYISNERMPEIVTALHVTSLPGQLGRSVERSLFEPVHADEIQLGIDDPVLGHTGTLIETTLDCFISLPRAWGADLDDDFWCTGDV